MSNSIKRKLHGKTIKFYGPPGTGKTHRLLQRAKRFLRRGVLPDEICYISFTNKAVQECLDRVRKEFKGYDEDDFKTIYLLDSDYFEDIVRDGGCVALPTANTQAHKEQLKDMGEE